MEVRSLSLEHNHAVVPELFKHLPQQRQLPSELQAKARAVETKSQKMLVRQEMQGENGNTVLSKDLSNISAKGKDAAQRNNLLEVVRVLQREITQASLDRREQCLASYLLPRRSNEEVFP